jgi:predicted dehydrogenase
MKERSIGVGVIGAGFARTTQMPAFAACEGARVVAVASARRGRAEAAARAFGIPFVGSDWREVIERAEVNLVCVTTPPLFHREMTLAALAAGKAVLCEKPTAMSAAESAQMLAAAERAGVLALVDHELRFVPARRRAGELIAADATGPVRHAKILFRADSRSDAGRAWDWWSDAAAGGGTLGAIGSHAVDALRWLTSAEVSEVSCQLATHVSERPDPGTGVPRRVTTDDETNMLLRLAGGHAAEGATAAVSLSFVETGEPSHRVEIFGERGALLVAGGELWRAEVGGHAWERVEVGRAPLATGMHDNEWSRGFTVFAREIVGALREGRVSIEGAATFADGHRTQLVLDAARRSHEGGRREAVWSGGE